LKLSGELDIESLTTEKKLFRRLTWNIFKRVALFQILALIIASALALLLVRSKIKDIASNHVTNEAIYKIQTHLKYTPLQDSNFCNILDQDIKFIALMKGSYKKVCINQSLKNKSIQDIMYGHHKLNKKESKVIYNKKIGKKSLYYQGPFNINNEEYSLFLTQRPHKVIDFLLNINQFILLYIFPIIFLSALLSLYTSIKVATPIKSILGKIITFSNTYKRNNILSNIDNQQQSEWEIIEKSIDDNEYKKRKLQKNLVKESNKFQALLDALSDSIIAVGNDGKILFANNALQSQFNTSEEQLSEAHYLEVIRNHDLKTFIDGVINEGESSFSSEFKINHDNGETRDYYVKTNPLKDNKGRTYGTVCILNDLTELKVAQRMREDFVTNVSHEIRTPLTAIKGYVQTFEAIMPDLDESKKEILETINHNCDRLTQLFNDVLSLSMIENIVDIPMEEINLSALTDQSIRDISQIYPNNTHDVQINYNISRLISNEKMLEHIITNLVGNAYRYAGDNLRIEINWSQTSTHNHLTVSDNGIGIEAKHLPRLFERFYRVDKSRVRDQNGQSGTGLGLAIVKHVVNKLGGRIQVESTIGSGTSFKIQIPKRQLV